MASKFQNRLVGTIVLVALGVIILPGCWTGRKALPDEFAAIPLVPKPGDRDEPDMLPAATRRCLRNRRKGRRKRYGRAMPPRHR